MWEGDTSKGEKHLALDLYEFLYNQGVDFMIEPASVSGEADLVAAQTGEYPLIADAKIYNPDKGKGKDYIAKALNQIYIYTQDYNEPFGYMVVYKTSDDELRVTSDEKKKVLKSVLFVLYVTLCIATLVGCRIPAGRRL
ncbi:MAG: hypothetical protein SWK76_07330 [Actinomycetota bacterium]|nr:hypothetical protein [Actinomycetota bacterium]